MIDVARDTTKKSKMAEGNNQGNNRNNSWSTGEKVFAGALGVAAVGAGIYALSQLFGEEAEKPKETPNKTNRTNNNDSYVRYQCVLCDDRIIDNAKKLSCSHVIHLDCLRSLIVNGSTRCPKCYVKLTDEDLYHINKAVIDNRANQLNPNHLRSGPGRPAGYPGTGDKPDLDNHCNQLNPNNEKYQGGNIGWKHNYQ